MTRACPVCERPAADAVWSPAEVPVFQFVTLGEPIGPGHVAPLEIVRCRACHHLFNRAYRAELAQRMYGGDRLTNVPVHAASLQHLQGIAERIGTPAYTGKRVVEVGAGSGHLARILAYSARSVAVFEPCLGLRPDMVPEPNVTVVNAPFAAARVEEPADLIVCRQVLEHVADPLALLQQIRQALRDDGALYLEVPRAEYIEAAAALFDFHYAHVQYFHLPNLLALAAKAGFTPERHWHLKNHHDAGVMLRAHPRASDRPIAAEEVEWAPDLGARLEQRLAQGRSVLRTLTGAVALYGASTQGVAFLNAFQGDVRFAAALDDNADYEGCALYSPAQTVPIAVPTTARLAQLDAVLIIAYLHEPVILARLQERGFAGKIFRVEPQVAEMRRATKPGAPRERGGAEVSQPAEGCDRLRNHSAAGPAKLAQP